MTIIEWIRANKKIYGYSELTVCNTDNSIILDDRINYLPARTKEYNAAWKAACKGKNVLSVVRTQKGVIVTVGNK